MGGGGVTADGGRLLYPQQRLPPEGAEIHNLTAVCPFHVSHSNRMGHKHLGKKKQWIRILFDTLLKIMTQNVIFIIYILYTIYYIIIF